MLLRLLILIMLLTGCVNLDSQQHANQIANNANLQISKMEVNGFVLTSYSRINHKNQPLNIYIEGDGLAWLSRRELSQDPTPRVAAGLSLATQDSATNVVYLARPCQFNDFSRTACDSAYWSNKRFSEKVIETMDLEIDSFVRQTNNQRVNLIGYSGGAAIAVLIAARRRDVASIRTVAGNLDTEYVNQFHHVDAMPESLNPIDVAFKIEHIPQLHFIGAHDKVIPREVVESFIRKQSNSQCAKFVAVSAEHQKNWVSMWPSLLKTEIACKY